MEHVATMSYLHSSYLELLLVELSYGWVLTIRIISNSSKVRLSDQLVLQVQRKCSTKSHLEKVLLKTSRNLHKLRRSQCL